MASAPDAAGPATLPDAARDSRSDSDDVESEIESAPAGCRWAHSEYHDRECSRYLDCPTHTIERRLSVDQTDGEHTDTRPQELELRDDSAHGNLYDDADSSRQTSPAHSAHADSGASTPLLPQQVFEPEQPLMSSHDVADPDESPSEPAMSTAPDQQGASQSSWVMAHSQPSTASLGSADEATQRQDLGQPSRPLPQSPPLSPEPVQYVASPRQTVSPSRSTQALVPNTPRPSLPRPPHRSGDSSSSDLVLPRWQPDAEVTYCPICHTQFSFFVRKHHCRKCGRVVCNACSPHRIIIPHQYIVRPPGTEIPVPQSLLMDSLGVGYFDVNGASGGERVRLCNPCVPDPNTAPPQNSTTGVSSPSSMSPRSSHQRSRSSMGNAYGAGIVSNRYGMSFAGGQAHDPFRAYAPRSRSITMNPSAHAIPGPSSSGSRASAGAYYSSMRGYPGASHPSTSVPSYPNRFSYMRDSPSSSRQRVLPPTPQIAEEDECPICHRELPQRSLPNFEILRESHINNCIQSHSTYRIPGPGGPGEASEPEAAPRRTGMYSYPATEKDCIDDAECTICLEEFTVGIPMARLECLCRFHRSCISAWFVNHPGRCPVHQHDGFGY